MEPCVACYKRCGTEMLCKHDPLPIREIDLGLMEGFEFRMPEWMAYL